MGGMPLPTRPLRTGPARFASGRRALQSLRARANTKRTRMQKILLSILVLAVQNYPPAGMPSTRSAVSRVPRIYRVGVDLYTGGAAGNNVRQAQAFEPDDERLEGAKW